MLTKDGVDGVHGDLVLGRISDEALGVGEGDVRGRGAVTLVVGDNLNAVITEDTYARVGSSKVDTNRGCHDVDVYVWWGIKGKEKFVICSQVGDL